MVTSPIIAIKNLGFSYLEGKPVIDIPKLNIERAEKIFLFGPSGSGKTTLLGLLTGVLSPDEGEINILGCDITQLSDGKRDEFRGSHIGYIFQMFNLIPYLSVYDNIVLPCQLSPVRAKRAGKNLQDKVMSLAQGLDIDKILDVQVTQLSVGQQQRVAATRALMGEPEILIADEPTSALDFDHRERFLEKLFAQCETHGTTLIFVSHDKTLLPLFDRSLSLTELNRNDLKAPMADHDPL